MKSKTRRCRNCRRSFKIKHNPNQCYCSHADCQKTRKNSWRRQKRRTDSTYLANNNEANNLWRQKHPSYWKHYRKKRTEYTQKNRLETSNRKRQQQNLLKIWQKVEFAKSDASLQKDDLKSKTYVIILGERKSLQRATRSRRKSQENQMIGMELLARGEVCKETTL